MVTGIRFVPFPDSVRVVGADAAMQAGCAAGSWLDSPRGETWETLVTPVSPPLFVYYSPGDDLGVLYEQYRDRANANAGVLFLPAGDPMPDMTDQPRSRNPYRQFRVKAVQRGAHIHVNIWAGTPLEAANRDRPKLGQLIMDQGDWIHFIRLFTWAPDAQVEVDTEIDHFDGTGSTDADVHLAGFRGFDGCPRGDCPTPGLCSETRCLAADEIPRGARPVPVAEQLDHDEGIDPYITFAMPPDIARVWLQLTGVVESRPGSTGWAVTLFRDGYPIHLVTDTWQPGQDPAPVNFGIWVPGDPGATISLTTRLDGATWVPQLFLPTTLRITETPPLPPFTPGPAR